MPRSSSHGYRRIARLATSILTAVGATVFGITIAYADVITTFNLSGVTFSDGATATGSFTYDSTLNTAYNVNITTSGGTLPGTTYTDTDCGPATTTCNYVHIGYVDLGSHPGSADILQFEFAPGTGWPTAYYQALDFDFYLSSFSLSSPDSILVNPQTPFTGGSTSAEYTCGSSCPWISYLDAAAVRDVTSGQIDPTPLPAALPLFATGLSAMGLLGWRRKRKNAAAIAAA